MLVKYVLLCYQMRIIRLTGLRLCLMRAANRRLASPRTPAWSLASHHSMTRASSTASLPSTKAASSDTHSTAEKMKNTLTNVETCCCLMIVIVSMFVCCVMLTSVLFCLLALWAKVKRVLDCLRVHPLGRMTIMAICPFNLNDSCVQMENLAWHFWDYY